MFAFPGFTSLEKMSRTCGPVKWNSIAVLHCFVFMFLPSLIIRSLPSSNNSIMVPTKQAPSDNQTWELALKLHLCSKTSCAVLILCEFHAYLGCQCCAPLICFVNNWWTTMNYTQINWACAFLFSLHVLLAIVTSQMTKNMSHIL